VDTNAWLKLICGNAVDVLKSMNTSSVDAIITDPPYGIGLEYKSYNDSRDAWFELMNAVVPEMRRVAKFVIMPCCAIGRMGWWYANHEPDWVVSWYKGSPGHRSNVGFNDWEPHLTWGFPSKPMHDVFQTRCGFDSTDNGHPCPKPVEYTDWLVRAATNPEELVMDPFMGSGTTGVSCVTARRRFIGVELDENYFAIAERRIELATNGNNSWVARGSRPPIRRMRD
jgi:site-specific DNA-methyltransferase (adenine-specific)